MVKQVKFVGEYNEWHLEQLERDPEDGRYKVNLNRVPRLIRLFWHIQFKGFFIHIGRDVKRS